MLCGKEFKQHSGLYTGKSYCTSFWVLKIVVGSLSLYILLRKFFFFTLYYIENNEFQEHLLSR